MAMPGYFIEVTFTDGSVVTTYATVIGEWYYFYSDKRYRFTRGTGTNVLLQQYQPIGTNMAWYDINIIKSVYVQQFDPSTAGGGAAPDDVYTKEEVNTLIENAVNQIMSNIDEIVAQKVNEAISSGLGENYYTKQEADGKFVKKSGDTMTGALYIRNGDNYFYCNGNEATLFGENYNVYMNPADGFGITTKTGKYMARTTNDGHVRLYNADQSKQIDILYDNAKVYGSSSYSFNTTLQVPSSASFLIAGALRLKSNGINRYGDDVYFYFNDNLRTRFTANGQVAVYSSGGNNCWLSSNELTFWVNGGTSQCNMLVNDASQFIFSKSVFVQGSEIGVGNASYTSTGINTRESAFNIALSGVNKMQINNTTTVYYNSMYVTNDNPGITFASGGHTIGQVSGNSGGFYVQSFSSYPVYVRPGAGASGNCSLFMSGGSMTLATGGNVLHNIIVKDYLTENKNASLSTYVTRCLSSGDSPSNTILDVLTFSPALWAINQVINAIQDKIGTNYSAEIRSQFLAGGGSSRGGGVGRGY